MPFKYRARNADAWDKRANQTAGDFEGYVRDDFKVWSPKKGSHIIRILPPTFDFEEWGAHYGIDIYVHFSVGPNKASVLCLSKMRNERCPICEARMKWLNAGDEDLAKELRPVKRILVWIIDRNDEERGVMAWAMPFTLDADLAKLAKDRRTGAISPIDHPDEGFDVIFERSGDGIQTQYGGKQLDRQPSSVDDKFLSYVEAHPLPDILIWRSYDEVQKLYSGGVEPEEKSNGAGMRRRAPNGGSEAATRRAVTQDEDEPNSPPLRRVAGSEGPRSRREEINDEVPFDGARPIQEEQPESPVSRLKAAYRNRGGE